MADDGGGAQANNVYIRSDEFAWVPARLVEQDKETAKVAIPQYEAEEFIASDGGAAAVGFKSAVVKLKDYPGRMLPLQNCGKDGTLTEVDDMVDLPYLHEAAILFNLKARHIQGKPYARVADIVIAVNPYQWMTDLYTDEVRMHYAQKLVWETSEKDPRIGLPPHIYEVSSLCYKGLALNKQNQSILVSGESGAGKSETVKICMNHIATVQQDPNDKQEGQTMVVKRILDSNPLLEAFGNAKTRRNDNSSRFGKYIMLQFHHIPQTDPNEKPRAALAGSACDVYLLEKSRVVYNEDVERTYHIFYQLLAAPEEKKIEIWKGLKGTKNESFTYVGPAPHVLIDGMEDGDHFGHTAEALALVGVEGDSYLTLFRAIAASLQLGNMTFAPKPGNDEETVITSKKEFKDLAELLACDTGILEKAFTERTIKTRGEEYKVPLKSDVSKESADAFAKEIYAKVFLWLVRAINDATCAENNYPNGKDIEYGLIGLLDIFGFESFPINGFEQLCINYCNEKLQQKFTRDIFRTVQEEYTSEGLNLDDIKYDDNSDVLALIEDKVGLIKQLNEECVRPKGNDEAFVSKMIASNKTVPALIQKRTFSRVEFGIHHFAGAVIYRAQDFVIRNTDTLPADLQQCATQCGNEIIAKHLGNNKCSNQTKKSDAPKAPPKRAKSNLQADTVMTQFKTQLTSLMTGLETTQSRYIRCVKPNTLKKKLVMQHITTMEQLRCAGVIAAVLISRSAYPSKLMHDECVEKYGMLNENKPKGGFPDKVAETTALCEEMLAHLATEKKDGSMQKGFAIGKTRAYFRAGCLEYLESERSKIWDKWAAKIQRIVRGFVKRAQYKQQKAVRMVQKVVRGYSVRIVFEREKSVLMVQKVVRGYSVRIGYEREKYVRLVQTICRGYIVRTGYEREKFVRIVQTVCRGFIVQKELVRRKYARYATAVIPIQAVWRMAIAKGILAQAKKDKKRMKRMGKKSKKSAVKIQALIRGFIQIPKFKALKEKKKEEADLANQLGKMKDKLSDAEDKRLRDIEDAKFQFEQDMEEYKEKLEDQLRSEAEKHNKSAQQQTLIDESGKIIEYLRKENMKLRQQCESMKKDYKSLKENNARLMEANASASSSFNQLNDHAKGLNATNARLIKNVDTYKKQLVKMKEDLKNRQAFYLAEAHARVAYQKTLARIVAQVQDKSRDAQLVEDVVIWALECEAEAKSERAALENAGQSAPPGALKTAAPVRSNRPTDSDSSDDDSD
jgi:myosin-5